MKTKKSAGITLVELIVVIAMAGIISAWAVPNLVKMVEMTKLRTAANMIKRQMLVARTRAISDPYKHCGVVIDDIKQQSFVFFDNTTPYVVNTADTVNKYGGIYKMPRGDTLLIPSSNGIQNQCVVFRGDGSAKYGGSVQVKNKYNMIRTITVEASTGRVKVQ